MIITGKMKFIGICLVVFIIAIAVYANTLKGDFIWDDEYLILKNSQVKSFKHFGNVFSTYVGYGSENINNFYRPIQEISNMIDYAIWGEKPFGFHLTNIILHALVSVMVFIFLFCLTKNIMASGAAAVFYAVHPVHTEAVAYIAGRADSLYAFFMLLSLVLFIKSADKVRTGLNDRKLYALSIVFFILSLLSKELAITMPIIVFLYTFYFVRGTDDNKYYRILKWRWGIYAIIVGEYVYLRLTALNFSSIAPPSVFAKIPLVLRFVTFLRSVFIYLRLLVFPADLHMERTIRISKSLFEPTAALTIAAIIFLIVLARKTYKTNKLISFAILWFFISLIPLSNIVPINSFLAEHWIYVASIGPFLLFGMGISWLYKKISPRGKLPVTVFFTILAILIGLYARVTVLRNTDWKDEISFFNSALKYHPRNARLYLNLGNTYFEKRDIDKAIEQYKKAIEIDKNYAVAYGNIGSSYLYKKDIDEAEKYLVNALNLKYNYPIGHYNLGVVYLKRKRYDKALKEFKIATEQLPQFYQAWNMVGQTYVRLKDAGKAREAFQRSLEIMPSQERIRKILKRLPK